MYSGHLGTRHDKDDPNHLGLPERPRTEEENQLISALAKQEIEMRVFLMSIPNDGDKRAAATALTKLDELVMWARRAIDN